MNTAKKQPDTPMIRALLRPAQELTAEDEQWVIGALMKLYSLQTLDEQSGHYTAHQNSVGFNAVDAEIMTDMAQFYERKGGLSQKQLKFLQPKLRKYLRQLEAYGVQPKPNAWGRKQSGPSKPEVTLEGEDMIIRFPYNQELMARVKTLSNRRWKPDHPGGKAWVAPLCVESYEALLEWGFSMDSALLKWYKSLEATGFTAIDVPGLGMELFPFQKVGVGFIESRQGRALIGDEMGLGKTAQALAYLQLHPKLRPAVVVCPASLKLNWQREAHMWLDNPVTHVLSGRKAEPGLLPPKNDIFIINYDILDAWWETLLAEGVRAVIIDECHYIKNSKAKRTKASLKLARHSQVESIIALSGTPIVNRPVEFFTTLNLLRRDLFPSFWRYAQEFCGARHNGFGWDFTGATKTNLLHEKVKPLMIRRVKEDVLTELPPKRRQIVPVNLDNWDEYREEAQTLRDWIQEAIEAGVLDLEQAREMMQADKSRKQSAGAEALVLIEKLKQLCLKGKKKAACDWLHDYLETADKLVVFATHHATIDYLKEEMARYNPVVIDGRVSMNKRQEAVDRFQADPECRLFLGNIRAAGVGLTLTASNATCFLELGWTPGEHDQAEDRVHRIGQTADSVMAYYLIASGTIEEDIAQLLDKKRRVLDAVLDGKATEETSLLMELLNLYKTEAQ
jgi:SNF2 family DNA or RNA helicase